MLSQTDNTNEVILLVSVSHHDWPETSKKTIALGMRPQFTKRELYRHRLNAPKPSQNKPPFWLHQQTLCNCGVVVPDHAKTVSLLSFQEGEKEMISYSSSNYFTVQTSNVN